MDVIFFLNCDFLEKFRNCNLPVCKYLEYIWNVEIFLLICLLKIKIMFIITCIYLLYNVPFILLLNILFVTRILYLISYYSKIKTSIFSGLPYKILALPHFKLGCRPDVFYHGKTLDALE